ncbi:fumarylacetoacetase [Thozetella sp. PMI_491]|nr:fumarylacetoacetase [Thozetella sp. PMI_491]
MLSWVPIGDDSDFSLQNLPYGVFSTRATEQRIGVAVGGHVLDLKLLARSHIFVSLGFDTSTLEEPTLNKYSGLGRKVHRKVRALLQDILRYDTSVGHVLRDNAVLREQALIPVQEVQMHLPMAIGDYTDFFTSPYHARNCTDIFRPGQDLPPAFFRQPLGYGGRSSSIVVSGTPIRRPRGQFVQNGEAVFGPCQKLDFEVEFAAFVGQGNADGTPIDVRDAEDHIFGFVLHNDWSARDIQKAEATPLGPLNGKNFCTTISPWIVTPEALELYRAKTIKPGNLLPYLDEQEKDSVHDIPIDVHLEVGSVRYEVAQCNTKYTCFSFAQMLAHHTAGGCPMRPGDLLATGTLSGPTRPSLGCFLESSWDGTRKCELTGTCSTDKPLSREWLQDGDVIHFTARRKCIDGPGYVGFGACSGQIILST